MVSTRESNVGAQRAERFGDQRLRLDVRDQTKSIRWTSPEERIADPRNRAEDRQLQAIANLVGRLNRVVEPIGYYGRENAEQ